MKPQWSLLLLLIGPALALASEKPPSRAEKEIVDLEKQWAECFRSGNPDPARQFIAENFIGISWKAVRYAKTEALKEISESKGVFSSFIATGITVRLYGETAVAQGRDVWVMADKSRKEGSSFWTDTWIRVHGKWQIVAAQDILPRQAGAK